MVSLTQFSDQISNRYSSSLVDKMVIQTHRITQNATQFFFSLLNESFRVNYMEKIIQNQEP